MWKEKVPLIMEQEVYISELLELLRVAKTVLVTQPLNEIRLYNLTKDEEF